MGKAKKKKSAIAIVKTFCSRPLLIRFYHLSTWLTRTVSYSTMPTRFIKEATGRCYFYTNKHRKGLARRPQQNRIKLSCCAVRAKSQHPFATLLDICCLSFGFACRVYHPRPGHLKHSVEQSCTSLLWGSYSLKSLRST